MPALKLAFAETQSAQLLMLAGFVLLGWVLARRTLRMRKRVNQDTRAAKAALKTIREHKEPAVPLCNAPPEIQRWQVAMYDTQRELTAELDTRIAIVQSLLRQMDDRIDTLGITVTTESTQSMAAMPVSKDRQADLQKRTIALTDQGLTAEQISNILAAPLSDIEQILATVGA
ncbi:hypothetical protein Q31b_07290 [Novipirellula aureliae]|uniref:DUF2802 domain-containing protein n=1 Tax=Novipirellula aureliae TaxID=2527966 RepID=A0A5C6EAN9_9BACT|nr:hypothetical protein [Novipirellula aureliae]TWU45554.1 hypothetical protein Q31b_07290 [Novipirellula aureliae]